MAYQVKALLASVVISVASAGSIAQTPDGGKGGAVEVDGSDIKRHLREREDKIAALTPEEKKLLRVATDSASEDPEVKAAAIKRNQAIEEFRIILHRSMVKADPSVGPLLDKLQDR